MSRDFDKLASKVWIPLFFLSLIVSSQSSFSIVGLPLYASQNGITASQLSLLLGAFPLATGLAAFFSGPVSDFCGRKRMLTIGLTLLATTLLAHVFAQDIRILLALRIAAGLATGALAGLPATFLSDHFGKDEQHSLIRKSISGYAIGHTIGVPVGIALIDSFGYLQLNGLLGLLALSLLLVTAVFLPRSEQSAAALGAAVSQYLRHSRRTLGSRRVQALLASSLLGFAATSLFHVTLTLWLYEDQGLEPLQLAPMFLAAGLLQVFVLGYLLRKLQRIAARHMIGASFLLNAALLGLAGVGFTSVLAMASVFALVSGVVALRIPSIQHLVNHAGEPGQKGLRMSIIQTGNHLGKAFGATAASLLYLSTPSWQVCAVAATLLTICSFLFLSPSTGLKLEEGHPGTA